MKLTNHSTETNIKTIEVKGGRLTYRQKQGDAWLPMTASQPLAFDFLTLMHGWVRYEKGTKAVPMLEPGDYEYTPEEVQGMHEAGCLYVIVVKVASEEIGGLRVLSSTDKPFNDAIISLYGDFIAHRSASLHAVPIVRHDVGMQSLVIEDFLRRPDQLFGRPCNSLPLVEQEPIDTATVLPMTTAPIQANNSTKPPADLLARLHARKAAQQNTAESI